MRKDQATVLILADGLPAGGTERQIVELLKGLRESREIEAAIGVLQKNGEREKEAFEMADLVIPIPQSKPYDITLAFSLISAIKDKQIDLLHTFGSISDLCGVIASKKTGIPLLCGSIRSARPSLNFRDRLSKFSMKYADWVVANSAAGLKAFGVEDWENVSVVKNGVDISRFAKQTNQRHSEAKSICMVGNFTRKKDQEALINAFPRILQKYGDCKIVFVGRGKNLPRCRELVCRLELQNHVEFHDNCNDPEDLISASNVGVLLSPGGEGVSNVILEYMALGKPVVATDLGGNREVVKQDITGILLPDHMPGTIAEAVCRILDDPGTAEVMGAIGRKTILQEYSLERMVKDYILLYKKLM